MDVRFTLMETLESFSENSFSVDVMDSSTVDWSKFTWENGYIKHFITQNEILRPYYLSYIYFGTTTWEYVLLELNGIDDIDNVPIGSEIWIPKLVDLEDFVRKNIK